MLEHILKLKNLVDNLAAIEEHENDRDQILQLLGGLWADYNSIVASLTTREDEVSLHTVHSILLTHERLNLQNSVQKMVLSLPTLQCNIHDIEIITRSITIGMPLPTTDITHEESPTVPKVQARTTIVLTDHSANYVENLGTVISCYHRH